jgi:tRNA(Ile)-lysidine synthase TilS/MesJ
MKKLINQLNTLLSQNTSLNPKEFCIFGISGGQDSIFLFFVFLHLKKQWNINIQFIHFHHFWQKKNFFCTQQIVKLAFLFKFSVYIIPSVLLLENEKKARQWRQKGFNRVSSIEKSTKILTAHTGSDRLETAFWHLIRGTSPQGLLSLKLQTQLKNKVLFFNESKFLVFSYAQSSVRTTLISQSRFYGSPILQEKLVNKKSNLKSSYKKRKNKKKMNTKFCFTPFTNKKSGQSQFFCFKKPCFLKQRQKSCLQIQKNSFFYIKNQEKSYCFLIYNFWFSKKDFLRPLLFFHRTDVTFFCKKYSLPVLFDPSNQNLRWFRNRIRYQLFPILRFFFNPHTEYSVNNFLEISSQEQKYIEDLIEKILQYWLSKYQKNFIFVHNINSLQLHFQFKIFPKALQRRLVQRLFHSYRKVQPTSLQIEIVRKNI